MFKCYSLFILKCNTETRPNRHITSFVKQSLKDFSAVLIIGARQVGKSTVVKQLYDEGIFKSYITLDDISQLEAAYASS